MTIVNTESRLGMAAVRMPRVNLIPPEIAEKARMQKVQMGLGAGVLAVVGVVGLLFVSASHGVSSAQDSLDTADKKNAQLQAETAKYANVTAVYQAAERAQGQLVTAMGDEVRYSQLLHDLSLSVPSTVWLKGVTYTQSAPGATQAAPAGGTAATAAVPSTSLGTVSFTGIGFNHDDLALWLESIAGLKQYGSVYFSNATEGLIGDKPGRKVVNFQSTADLTRAALSGRFTKPQGG